MKEYSRTDRIAQVMQQELAHMIQREVKDPRLPAFVTVEAVVVSKDLAHAKVYITTLKPEDQLITLEILQHAAGFLRTQLSKRIKLRTTPQLRFVYDTSIEYGNRLANLINRVAKETPPEDSSSSEQ